MANIKSIGGNPIVLGLDGLSDEVTHGDSPILSVGRADALTGADSTAQWATRVTAGSGAATVRSVQGAAVGWNQLIRLPNTSDTVLNGAVTRVRKTDDGTVTLNGTAVDTGSTQYILLASLFNITLGHKYYLAKHNDALNFYITVNGSNNQMTNVASIFTAGENRTGAEMYMVVPIGGYTFDNFVCVPQLIDLTAMFGSGNEPTTVAEFERMYPEAYYPYSAPTLKSVQISGIRSTTAQGGELDAIEWTAQTLRAAGSVRDELTADELVTRVGVVDLGTLTWTKDTDARIDVGYMFMASLPLAAVTTNKECAKYTVILNAKGLTAVIAAYGSAVDQIVFSASGSSGGVYIIDSAYTDAAAFKTAMNGVYLFYELATPTTTPISPELTMSYKVEQGGTESIIVPEGEISAVPLLTVAEGKDAATVVMDALACIAAPDGPVATANHALNTYLTMGGKLYKVTSAIAVGETITAGTNVTETTVMDELIALTA